MVLYEEQLNRDLDWAFREGSMHFEQTNAVHRALRKITRRLDEIGVPYAVADGMALFSHGFRRFTEDVDVLVTAEGLKTIHNSLDGLGYISPFAGSRQLRDAELGVRIDFLVTGQFPGDGKPKPVAFPDPLTAAVETDGIKFLALPAVVELKLASGISNPGRLKDLADVQELIRVLKLPREFSIQLNSYVQAKFLELWDAVQASGN